MESFLALVICIGFYFLGRLRGQNETIKWFEERGLLEPAEPDPPKPPPITIEKINSVYYAYYGNTFVGQGRSLETLADSLVYSRKMRKLPAKTSINVSEHLNQAEVQQLIECIGSRMN